MKLKALMFTIERYALIFLRLSDWREPALFAGEAHHTRAWFLRTSAASAEKTSRRAVSRRV